MKLHIPVTGYFLFVLFSWVFFTGRCSAEAIIGRVDSIEGFDKLTWGISVEQAKKACPDLYFGVYEIVNRKEEPVKIYYRSASPEKMDGVVFDSYEYWFKRDGFYKVRGSLQSKFGPRTLATRAEASFARLVEYLRRKYGEPKGHWADYKTEYLVVAREMRWEAGGVFIHLKYEGPEEANEDLLVFEMGK